VVIILFFGAGETMASGYSILPPMTLREALETTKIHSVQEN
jgi:predicted ATPase with chaperone activity